MMTLSFKIPGPRPDVVLHAFNPNILEEVGGFVEFEASFDYMPGQSGEHIVRPYLNKRNFWPNLNTNLGTLGKRFYKCNYALNKSFFFSPLSLLSSLPPSLFVYSKEIDCPGTNYIDQTGLEHTGIHLSLFSECWY